MQLTHTASWVQNMEPAWSPDGKSVVFSRRTLSATGSAALYVLYLSTGKVAQLTKTWSGRGDREPAWSSDGRQIAFTSDRKGPDDIYAVNIVSRAITRLTTKASIDTHPSWAPSGNMLAFMSDRTGATEIHTLDLSGRTDRPLKQITFDRAFKSNPAWERFGPTD